MGLAIVAAMEAPFTLALSWEDIHRDARALARRLAAKGRFTGIIAVARGGLVPAAILARELDIRLVDTVCIASYDDRCQGSVEVLKRLDGDGDGWLVVDDLVDSGATVAAVRAMLPHAHYATLYTKPAGHPLVDTFVDEVAQDVWIVFPWEG
jgi:hypoxanthine phosphoribosyltransferase